MPFLSGSVSFERFIVNQFAAETFEAEHIESLERFSSQNMPRLADQEAHVGFSGGEHVLDNLIDIDKNIIGDALHCSVRVETDQIPSAIRKAWLQIELQALAAENTSGRPTKKQRQEAKETVQKRCEEEAASGKYRRMQHYPMLWDAGSKELFVGGTSNSVLGLTADLVERAFNVQLDRQSAGEIARTWARQSGKLSELEDLHPAAFVPAVSYSDVNWANEYADRPDYLGNEFMLWLWWHSQNIGDTVTTEEVGDIVFMFAKTLTLECPIGEHGKETISSDSPIELAEARQAIQTGKLPRKAGLTIVAGGEQYDIVLQAESFGVSGAKIQRDDSENSYSTEDRVNSVRAMRNTIDALFFYFCSRRISEQWQDDLSNMQSWLSGEMASAAAA
ncbi:MAG: hypothetical protein Aurels2KO_49760 [Aureliella sp.]